MLDQDLGAIRGFMFEDHISSVDGNFCERLWFSRFREGGEAELRKSKAAKGVLRYKLSFKFKVIFSHKQYDLLCCFI